MTVLIKKELRRLFGGICGFSVIAILLIFSGFYTVFGNMLSQSPDFSISLSGISLSLIFTLPLLGASTFVKERKCKAEGLLYSLSFRPADLILGNYFAHLSVFVISMAVIALYPLLLSFFGAVDIAKAYFAWLGLLLLGAALLSLCLFLSLFFKRSWINWLVSTAALLSLYLLHFFLTSLPSAAWFSFVVLELLLVGVCVLLWLVVGSRVASLCTAILPATLAILFIFSPKFFVSLISHILAFINPFSRFSSFVYGSFDLEGILFFLCFAFFFIALTIFHTSRHRDDGVIEENQALKKTPSLTKKRLLSVSVSLILAILLIAVNLLASLLPWRIRSFRFSEDPVFDLSAASSKLLSSLDEDVTLYMLCDHGSLKPDKDILSFLKNYELLSSRISVEVIDSKTDTDFLSSHGIDAIEDGAICFVVESARRYMILSMSDLYYYHYVDESGDLLLSPADYNSLIHALPANHLYSSYPYFNGEEGVTNAIRFVTLDSPPVVAILQAAVIDDRSGDVIPINYPISDSIIQSLRQNSCDIRFVTSVSELNAEHELLLFNTPLFDLTESESTHLSNWLDAGGNMLLTTYCRTKDQPNLMSVLNLYGLSADDKNIRINEEKAYYLADQNTHVAVAPDNQLTKPVIDAILSCDAHAIYLDLNREDVSLTRILHTSTEASRSSYDSKTGEWKKLEEDPTSYTFGALAEKEKAKILWISTPYFTDFADSFLQNGNYQLLLSSIDYLSKNSPSTIEFEANAMVSDTLTVTQSAFVIWLILLVGVLPLSCFFAGLLRRSARRKS